MPCAPVALCKPCLNKKWPLRKQLLWSFISLDAASLVLALGVVLATTWFISDKAKTEARQSLEDQIKRHLKDASVEAAATIGERFRKLQYGVLDVTAFALRDALEEDLALDGGGRGYPLSPTHEDLRDTNIETVTETDRQDVDVDLSRSVWYYSEEGSNTAAVVDDADLATIAQTARLDLLWPTMYANSIDTKAILMTVPLTDEPVFRYFPGTALSTQTNSLFACDVSSGDSDDNACYNPESRDWYTQAAAMTPDDDTGLGDVIVQDPYMDATSSQDWLVTLSRAVYSSSDADTPLGVVGVDVRLEQVQESVEAIEFLDSGYSILATTNGKVLASKLWDRSAEGANLTTVCDLVPGVCPDDSWDGLLSATDDGVHEFEPANSEGKNTSIIIAAPVNATFDIGTGAGTATTHYILSAVPRSEIFAPVDSMLDKIWSSTITILAWTASAAAATLVVVAIAVYLLAGTITRPIVKMTAAARSIAKDGAKTDVFGGAAAAWSGGGGAGGSSVDSGTAGASKRGTRIIDYLLCRGDDEISTLAREFELMITGLGKRGSAARATGLEDSSVYPKNIFTTNVARAPSTARPAPTAPTAPASSSSS